MKLMDIFTTDPKGETGVLILYTMNSLKQRL